MNPYGLTDRQLSVARLYVDGYTRVEIAGLLGIAERTVKCHLDAIRHKLGISHVRLIGRKLREWEGTS